MRKPSFILDKVKFGSNTNILSVSNGLLFPSSSSGVRASSSRKSEFSVVGFHFGEMQFISIFAVSMHCPGFSHPRFDLSCEHKGQPQFLRPMPDGFTWCGFRMITVLRFAMLRVSWTIRTLWFNLRQVAASRRHAFLCWSLFIPGCFQISIFNLMSAGNDRAVNCISNTLHSA